MPGDGYQLFFIAQHKHTVLCGPDVAFTSFENVKNWGFTNQVEELIILP